MKFDLIKPCSNCPFSKKQQGFLDGGRMEQIATDLLSDKSFNCHKTTHKKDREQSHCAGALIFLEKNKRPNQAMRFFERLGIYNHTKLEEFDMVFDTIDEVVEHHAFEEEALR